MKVTANADINTSVEKQNRFSDFLIDLLIYISVMFLVREIALPNVDFMVNALFYSFTTLLVASWRMKVRGVTWKELGLSKPKNFTRTLLLSAAILVTVIITLIIFEVIKDQLPFSSGPEVSNQVAGSRFGDLSGNFALFFSIIFLKVSPS